eukprot:813881-Pleurochrysis_carterae.AAC.1
MSPRQSLHFLPTWDQRFLSVFDAHARSGGDRGADARRGRSGQWFHAEQAPPRQGSRGRDGANVAHGWRNWTRQEHGPPDYLPTQFYSPTRLAVTYSPNTRACPTSYTCARLTTPLLT